ncbi:MAG: PadR family transcriptional regulator [Candidatus Bathyarchaeota archaeon]|nr:PadR family transcriptional regulator [Candidatus Bathyarchaeota archaeon]MDH5494660.1 PadR family transcriptional regulator [Candidatus Bathyarchaeota archaeon]
MSRKCKHGYGLIKEIKHLKGYKLKPSVGYTFLHRLEEEGLATSERVKDRKRKLRYYSLTVKGKNLLSKVRDFFDKPIREVIKDFFSKQQNEATT